MDCFLITTFMWIIGKKTNVIRIIAAGCVGAVSACFSIIAGDKMYAALLFNIISVIAIILILYLKKMYLSVMVILRLFLIWYFNAFAMGGVFGYLINKEISIIILLRISFAVLIVMYILAGKNRINKMRNSNENIYGVTLMKGNKKLSGYGYYDSGCRIYEPVSGSPAIVASFSTLYCILDEGERYYINIFPRVPDEWDGHTHIRGIPFSAIGRERGMLPSVHIDEIIIENESGKKSYGPCYVAVCKEKITKDGSFEFLLHCNMKLGG